jgi:hypothetical protein
MPATDQLADSLFEAWLRDRGESGRRLTAAETQQIKAALVARARDEADRLAAPLEYCPTCRVLARGAHRGA